jgi:hypothetical protein
VTRASGALVPVALAVLGALGTATAAREAPARDSAGAAAPLAYIDGPVPGRTGGFGEATCRECHFSFDLNPPGGEAALEGLPRAWRPDTTYVLTVRVRHPEMGRAGFQLSARYRGGPREGRNAGVLGPAGTRTQVVEDTVSGSGVRYLQHTREGTAPVEGGQVRWQVEWRAPPASAPSAPVAFHLAGNAANDDNSEFGDRIYTAERTVPPTSTTAGDSGRVPGSSGR